MDERGVRDPARLQGLAEKELCFRTLPENDDGQIDFLMMSLSHSNCFA